MRLCHEVPQNFPTRLYRLPWEFLKSIKRWKYSFLVWLGNVHKLLLSIDNFSEVRTHPRLHNNVIKFLVNLLFRREKGLNFAARFGGERGRLRLEGGASCLSNLWTYVYSTYKWLSFITFLHDSNQDPEANRKSIDDSWNSRSWIKQIASVMNSQLPPICTTGIFPIISRNKL